jgi:hypothetical protein
MEGMECMAVGTKPSAHGTSVSRFSYKTHVDLSSCLTEECPHSLIERASNGIFDYKGLIMLLVVATVLSIYTQFLYFVKVNG